MTAAIVFAVQFAYVLLLGLQTRNVAGGHVVPAMVVSFLLGLGGVYTMFAVAQSAAITGDVTVMVAYVAAGPPAIALAIRLHGGRK